jgi:hypothetical protein
MNAAEHFLHTLYLRSSPLFVFGLLNLLLAVVCLVLARVAPYELVGTNVWYKPTKFALSTALLCWSMGWFMGYLPATGGNRLYAWGMVVLLGIEMVYITWMAARGERSHFNTSTPFYSFMYSVMAFAATAITLWTAVIGLQFWTGRFPQLPEPYLWGIRLGILLFTVFALEGFVMGGRLSHTIGGPDGGPGLPFLNWSRQYGNPRVAHFVGMHALQVLPLLGFFALRSMRAMGVVALLYGLMALYVLAQALLGKPLVR